MLSEAAPLAWTVNSIIAVQFLQHNSTLPLCIKPFTWGRALVSGAKKGKRKRELKGKMKDIEGKSEVKRGLWTPEEDSILRQYVETYGEGNWAVVSRRSGLKRGAKSCRLRWKNYLRPNIKHGEMSEEEQDLIIRMHKLLGNRWSLIAGRLPGRTDNEVKNYWNTHLTRKCGAQYGKRKTADSDNNCEGNNDDKRARVWTDIPPSQSREPVHGASRNTGGDEGEAMSNWMEELRRLSRDMESPLLKVSSYSSTFVSDDETSIDFFDLLPLF